MYLHICVCAAGEQIRKRRCKAAFSYVPQHEDELELKIGDVIEIIAEVRLTTADWSPDGDLRRILSSCFISFIM